ncbi:MAG: VOC family protein [Acidimicrobiales bacterium]
MTGIVDHLVYATDDLARTVASLTEQLGVIPTPGGQHLGRGTRNELVALGGATYLEIIGPDPEQRHHTGPMPFGIDQLEGERLVTWCARPTVPLDHVVRVVAAADGDPGEIADMWRARPDGQLLQWRLTLTRLDHHLGPMPFMIDWLDSEHPTASLDQPVVLRSLRLYSYDHRHLARLLAIMGGDDDTRLELEDGDPAIAAVLDTPNGEVVLAG